MGAVGQLTGAWSTLKVVKPTSRILLFLGMRSSMAIVCYYFQSSGCAADKPHGSRGSDASPVRQPPRCQSSNTPRLRILPCFEEPTTERRHIRIGTAKPYGL